MLLKLPLSSLPPLRRIVLRSFSLQATRAMTNIRDLRVPYSYDGNLTLNDVTIKTWDPFELFQTWMEDAVKEPSIKQPNKMVIATCSQDSRPSCRWVLLKDYNRSGFTFYTNGTSKKATEVKSNPHAALTLYWEFFHRQVRIEGTVSEIDRQEAEAYFITRPKGSQISASISPQSEVVADRAFLEQRYKELEGQYVDKECLPLPDNWGGYRVEPDYFEFWAGNTDRLHDRFVFDKRLNPEEFNAETMTKNENGWIIYRLAP